MNTRLKQVSCAFFALIFLTTAATFAQTAYQPEGLTRKVLSGVQIDLGSATIKDNDGNMLELSAAFPMIQSGKYTMETYVDEQERVREIVLRPSQVAVTVSTSTIDDRQDSSNPLKDELEAIRVKDQALRKLLGCIGSTFGGNSDSDSEEYKYVFSLIAQEDSKNQEQVIKIIDGHGWLGISQVGFFANNALFLVIQHAPVEMQEKYFPLLKESAEKGESRLADMALMDDRIRMRRNRKQLYGSQTTTVNGKNYVWPIEDAQNVDERRKQVQLQPLAEYLKYAGLSYPQDELPAELMK
ncbi:MAG: hypothetical protein LBE91_01125 [Tannerella sp.]|jgi:hypothetical protein|nr:hypothetical protein [Tannerella sp.]